MSDSVSGNFARGAIMEAKAAATIFKGYEWLAEITPFFKAVDFYDKINLIAVSYKTVNGLAENTKFANLYNNLKDLMLIKQVGKTAKYGDDRIVKGVQMYLQVTPGYKNAAFDAFVIEARKELGEANVIISSKHPE